MRIICIRGVPPTRCWLCHRPAPWLCDGPRRHDQHARSSSQTCDRGLCRRHRIRGGDGIDFCLHHDPRLADVAERATYQPELL